MRILKIAAALAAVAPIAAHSAPPSPAEVKATVDPERMALARKAVQAIIPSGTMQRIMKNSMGSMEDMMLKGMLDMKGADLGASGDGLQKTLRATMAEKDPHFEERMRITNRVMAEEMSIIFGKMEPRLIDGMARAYARRFTVSELTEINRFFTSSAGASFARQSFEITADPEITAEMMAFLPEMMKDMPAIAEKLKKATAHLPDPPKKPGAEEHQSEDEDEEEPAA